MIPPTEGIEIEKISTIIYKTLKLITEKINTMPRNELDKVLKDSVTYLVFHTRGPWYGSLDVKFSDAEATRRNSAKEFRRAE